MTLLNYPVPELDVTLQEVGRVLQLTLSPDLYPEFKSTLEQQRELLQEAQQKLISSVVGQENWVTGQFKRGLLSCAEPALPWSIAVTEPLKKYFFSGARLLQVMYFSSYVHVLCAL